MEVKREKHEQNKKKEKHKVTDGYGGNYIVERVRWEGREKWSKKRGQGGFHMRLFSYTSVGHERHRALSTNLPGF